MTKESRGRRPHLQAQAGTLASAPLDGTGIREVRTFRVRSTGTLEHRASITAFLPTTEDGDSPPGTSLVLAHPPELTPLNEGDGLACEEERRRWEYDGSIVRVQVPFPLVGAGVVVMFEHPTAPGLVARFSVRTVAPAVAEARTLWHPSPPAVIALTAYVQV
jgi:hypothetical protein